MNHNNALRDSARLDLQRLHPPAHYVAREHDPIADRELTEPLLREPVRYALSRQERAAALALADLATYQIASRAIWARYSTPVTTSDPNNATEPTFDEQREIWGRYEVFRQHAYSYARLLNDSELMEHYATPTPAPERETVERVPAAEVMQEPAIAVQSWDLITSLQRAPGYRWPLYQFLKAARAAGKPLPKARDVLTGWKANTPPELEVMTDGVKYSDSVGNTKEADLKAIQQAIKGLLKK